MPYDHHQILQIGQSFRAVEQSVSTCLDEGGAEQQILRRVAAQAQLWRKYQARTHRVRAACEFHNFEHIASQIAYRWIDLREGNFH